VNSELNKVCLCQKYLANVVNRWSYVILILEVQFFWDIVYFGLRNVTFRSTEIFSIKVFQDNSVFAM